MNYRGRLDSQRLMTSKVTAPASGQDTLSSCSAGGPNSRASNGDRPIRRRSPNHDAIPSQGPSDATTRFRSERKRLPTGLLLRLGAGGFLRGKFVMSSD